MPVAKPITMTHEEWATEAKRRFGDDPQNWRFVCPSCGYVASVKDWKDAGAPEGHIGFSCIGRSIGSKKELGDKTGGPCNYAGGGLFALNPVLITFPDGTTGYFFDFAPEAS